MRSTHRAETLRSADSDGPPRGGTGAGRARFLLTTAIATSAVLVIPWVSTADSTAEARYPFDPACPWGRLANGKGMITRCLGEEEGRALLAGGTITTTGGSKVVVRGLSENPKSDRPEEVEPTPSQPGPSRTGDATPEKTSPENLEEKPTVRPVRVELGPLIPDEGNVTIGQLGRPMDRYRACVEQNGGLSGSTGEVRVHFLVRGERSRAEAVEVSEFRGVGKKAAQCIADVVDRRATGTPSQPMVGATLVFKLSS